MLENGEASDIAAGSREICDEAVADGIGDLREHDGDGLGLAVQRGNAASVLHLHLQFVTSPTE